MTTPAAGPDPAELLSQALRAQVGGPRPEAADPGPANPAGADRGRRRPLTPLHVILAAAVVGLMIGIAAGFLVLLR